MVFLNSLLCRQIMSINHTDRTNIVVSSWAKPIGQSGGSLTFLECQYRGKLLYSTDITDYTHANGLTCHAIRLGWLHSRYQATPTLPKHHGSVHTDSFNVKIWCVIPHLCAGARHDKTNRESCQIGIQSYGIPSGHTSLQDLLQHTSIPWIEEQDIFCMWFQLCRWPTNKEKSTRTLDLSQRCSYHMEEQQTTHDVNIFEDNRSTIAICTNNMRPGNSRTKSVDLKITWLPSCMQWNVAAVTCGIYFKEYISMCPYTNIFQSVCVWERVTVIVSKSCSGGVHP